MFMRALKYSTVNRCMKNCVAKTKKALILLQLKVVLLPVLCVTVTVFAGFGIACTVYL